MPKEMKRQQCDLNYFRKTSGSWTCCRWRFRLIHTEHVQTIVSITSKKMVDINPNSPQLIHSSTLIGCDAPMTSPQDPLVLLIMVSIIFHSSGVTWHTNTTHEITATVRSVDHTSTSSGTAGTCSAGFCGSVLWVNVSHPPQLVELSCHRHVFSSVQTDHLKTKITQSNWSRIWVWPVEKNSA